MKPIHIPFPSIEQLRNVVFDIKHIACLTGYDETGEPIYDYTLPLPTITFKGTAKLHGTNTSVAKNASDGLWVQSREQIIRVGQDNAGFAGFVQANQASFEKLIDKVYEDNSLSKDLTVVIYGEWAGKGIQREVAISELEKSFYIFGVQIASPHDAEFVPYWVDCTKLSDKDHRIFNVNDYAQYEITIDFNNLEAVQDKLEELTLAVEKECPVSKAFGVSGIGEGIVWVGEFGGVTHRFKIKGDKHKISKTKEAVPVATEKLDSFNEFVDYAVTKARFDQAIEKICGSYEAIDIRKLGDVIKWMLDDIKKEETDTLKANGLDFTEVSKYITAKTKSLFLEAVKKATC